MNSPLIKEYPDVSKVPAALDRENWVFSLSDTLCAGPIFPRASPAWKPVDSVTNVMKMKSRVPKGRQLTDAIAEWSKQQTFAKPCLRLSLAGSLRFDHDRCVVERQRASKSARYA